MQAERPRSDAIFEEQRRYLLSLVAWAALLLQLTFIGFSVLALPWDEVRQRGDLFLNLALVIFFLVAHSRRMVPAAALTCGTLAGVQLMMLASAFRSGWGSLTTISLFLLPMVASVGAGPRAALFFGVSTAAHYEACGRMAMHGVLPVGPLPTVMLQAAAQSTSCLIVGICLSVYEYHRQRTHKELVELLHHKERFLSEISHEVRSPLVGILSSAELLCKESDGSSELPGIILESSTQLLAVVNQVLEMSALMAQEHDRSPSAQGEVFHVDRDLVSPSMRMFKALATSKSLEYSLKMGEDIPLLAGPRDQLSQALANVLDNALKSARSAVEVKVSYLSPMLRIAVSDDGKGLNTKHVEGLFRPFERLPRQEPGANLGLNIASAIMEGLRGLLRVRSEPRSGNTFTLEVGVKAAENQQLLSPVPVQEDVGGPLASCQESLEGKLVLVLDDNAINRMVLSKQLKALGCRAVAVRDEEELKAWFGATEDEPDVLFLDLHLENGVRGTDVLRRLRPRWGGPVVGHSASVSRADRDCCKEAGMTVFLPKPVTVAQIESTLREVLE